MDKKKVIKVKFIGWWEGFDFNSFSLFNNEIINSKYILTISDNPDFVFYNSCGNYIDYVSDYLDSVKILVITEPMSSDFLFFDYCFGYEPFDYGGRNIFYPYCLYEGMFLKQESRESALKALKEKDLFCDFIYGHETKAKKRKYYKELLSRYKKVESAGSYLNNQDDSKVVSCWHGETSKYEFQKRCKFCLVIQETNYPWFVNEKITHAIKANEIPIFYGPEQVKKIFNPNRFIFIEDFNSDSELLDAIKKIDTDDSLFIDIISQPPFVSDNLQQEVLREAYQKLDKILSNKKIIRMTEYSVETMTNKIISTRNNCNAFLSLKKRKVIKLFLFFYERFKNNKLWPR